MSNRPTPTAIKELQGKTVDASKEPKPLIGAPPMPVDLSPDAQRVWHEMVPILLQLGTLGVSDADTLANYCETRVIWRMAQNSLMNDGIILISPQGKQRNPAFSIADSCLKQLRAFQAELGL